LEVNVIFDKQNDSQLTQSRPEKRVSTALDEVLKGIPSESVLYFSGGVDSALLATRLKELGRTNVLLFNYAFGEDDAEGQLAKKMAGYLGFDLKQVQYQAHQFESVLNRIGREYSYPFSDYSTVPTNLMVNASLASARSSGVVIEGTGADGLFGLATKLPYWRRIYRIPSALRAVVAKTYNWFDLWKQQNVLERAVRLIRRSTQMSLLPAGVLAQNPLDGIAYDIPDVHRKQLIESIDRHLIGLVADLPPEEKFNMLDILHVCAGIFAAKSFDPLRRRGISAVYPYLEPNVLRAANSLDWTQKSKEGEEKSLLKNMLAEHVPSEWVYRPKAGFVPPIQSLLASSTAQSYIREVVLAETGPLREFLNRDRVRDMIDAAAQEKALGGQTYYFLWGIIMATAWLRQQP
jgi:asparagine synthetase B (glutamine-hydrolysing)